jgi:hypothetical protein
LKKDLILSNYNKMENTNYNFIGPSALKKHKGESVLLSTEIIRFDECDE